MDHVWLRTGEAWMTNPPKWCAICPRCGQHCEEMDGDDIRPFRRWGSERAPITDECPAVSEHSRADLSGFYFPKRRTEYTALWEEFGIYVHPAGEC